MRHVNRRLAEAVALLLVLSSGCSKASAPSETSPTSAQESGGEEPEAASEEAASKPVAAPRGPATLRIEVLVKGESKPADVQVIAEDGSEVASGKTGESLSLQSGEYTLLVSIDDAKVLADRPTRRLPLTVQPGEDLEQQVEFPWASVQLNVRVNGQLEKNATVRVMKQGAEVVKVKSAGEHVTLSPGRYQAVVSTRGATIAVEQVLFPEGATQTVPVDVRM